MPVDKIESGDPVSVHYITIALVIVLSPAKIPHQVPEVHVSELIGKKKAGIVPECCCAVNLVSSSIEYRFSRIP